ncbi:MAG: hypothetical protein ACR2ML_14130 [Solirubrobacteraceae bacterium]
MVEIAVAGDAIAVGDRFSVTFQRTLRVPADGSTYPLPPGLGSLPVLPVDALGDRAPAFMRERGGFFVPLYQSEALWLAFGGAWWKPNAVQVGVGGVNAISAEPWEAPLEADPQNYVVCPEQMWLDGINAGDGFVRQFVAVALGSGATVEGQLTGAEEVGGLQLRVYEPGPSRFPERAPERKETRFTGRPQASPQLGVGAGGRLRQKIYPDPYGVATWEPASAVALFVHLVNSEQYQALTGREAPPSPVSAALYTEHGLPWFDLYEETAQDVSSSERLAEVEPMADEVEPVLIDPAQVRGIDLGGRGS